MDESDTYDSGDVNRRLGSAISLRATPRGLGAGSRTFNGGNERGEAECRARSGFDIAANWIAKGHDSGRTDEQLVNQQEKGEIRNNGVGGLEAYERW